MKFEYFVPRSFNDNKHSFSINVRYKCPGIGFPINHFKIIKQNRTFNLPAHTSVSSNFCRNGECGSGSAK